MLAKKEGKHVSRSSNNNTHHNYALRDHDESEVIPSEILDALVKPRSKFEDNGPPKNKKELFSGKTMLPSTLKGNVKWPTENLWHYPASREKYKHLIDQPPCSCGAGRDISFLCDASRSTSSPGNDNGPKGVKPLSLSTNSLIPDEFHIVKKPGVLGLEIHNEQYTTIVDSHKGHLTMFPSMKPSGRQEALQLLKTMDVLLQKAGVDDEEDLPSNFNQPEQIHSLLELIKKEQTIYNVVFAEIIRQVSVDCAERGQLLATLRNRYVNLLGKVPCQIKSLHEEILAQRALDRRLTEELTKFKSTIASLNRELKTVQNHDQKVTRQALETQEELEQALKESQKNAGLLSEFHELYDLQRKRLEQQIERLIEEKDIWAGAAYTMAIKVTMKHNLTTAKRLHLHEKSWHKLTGHFVIVLSDADSVELEELSKYVQQWHNMAIEFEQALLKCESQAYRKLIQVRDCLVSWSSDLHRVVSPITGTVHPPDSVLTQRLHEDLKSWEEIFSTESERFTGDALLSYEDNLINMANLIEKWTECGIKLFTRQTKADKNSTRHPQHDVMLQLNKSVVLLQNQFRIRMNGDNGSAKIIIDFVNALTTWTNKLTATVNGGGDSLMETEWIQLTDRMLNEWLDNINKLIRLLTNGTSPSTHGVNHEAVDHSTSKDSAIQCPTICNQLQQLLERTHNWLLASINAVECADASICDQLSDTHSSMIRWMCTVLLRLAPDFARDKSNESNEALGIGSVIISQSSKDEICHRGHFLISNVRRLTRTIKHSCHDIVVASTQSKRDQLEDDAEVELIDLKKMENEAEEWVEAANILAIELTGNPITVDENEKEESHTKLLVSQQSIKPSGESDGGVKTISITNEESKDTREIPCDDLDHPLSIEPSLNAAISEDTYELHSLGSDHNVSTQIIANTPLVEQHTPNSSDTNLQEQVESLTTLDEIQKRLLQSEMRAVESETRALKAEEQLNMALKTIRELGRNINNQKQTTSIDD